MWGKLKNNNGNTFNEIPFPFPFQYATFWDICHYGYCSPMILRVKVLGVLVLWMSVTKFSSQFTYFFGWHFVSGFLHYAVKFCVFYGKIHLFRVDSFSHWLLFLNQQRLFRAHWLLSLVGAAWGQLFPVHRRFFWLNADFSRHGENFSWPMNLPFRYLVCLCDRDKSDIPCLAYFDK